MATQGYFSHGLAPATLARIQGELALAQENYSLPQAFYCDNEIFDADMQAIWYRDWLYVLPACEIAKAGNYIVHEVGAYSVIIVRGNDGVIRAFHNSCRHRGSVLCKTKKGSNPKLVCPYHQWTYELDGRLLWARDMGPDFDASKHGLKEVHCRDLSGMVYICLADVAPDISALEAATKAYLAPHDIANSKVAHSSTIIEKGNWKLVWENNRECYHCAGNHPSLCRTYPDDPRAAANNSEHEVGEALKKHVERCEAAGAPSAYKVGDDDSWRFVRIPLMGVAESYTMDGKVACLKPNSSIPFKDAGSLHLFAYPVSWNHFLSDHILTFRITPISTTETEVRTTWLVHKDAVEGQDYDLKRLTEVWEATNDEDREVVENNQRGIQSPAYQPGPYSETHEGGLIQFQKWYKQRLSRLFPARIAAE